MSEVCHALESRSGWLWGLRRAQDGFGGLWIALEGAVGHTSDTSDTSDTSNTQVSEVSEVCHVLESSLAMALEGPE